MKTNFKYLLFSTFLFFLIGCGGGTTTTEEFNSSEQQSISVGTTLDNGINGVSAIVKPAPPIPVLATTPEDDSATLSWQAPTVNADGSVLTDLVGYYIYYGKVADYGKAGGVEIDVIDIQDATAITHTITGIKKRDYFFAISAYSLAGIESVKVAAIPATVN